MELSGKGPRINDSACVGGSIIPISKYRKLLGDAISSEELVLKRLQYLEEFCRNLIRQELRSYAKKN